MKIKELGGEFALIERLTGIVPSNDIRIIQGIGDDAAVLQTAPDPAPYLLVTNDMLVEGRHFNRRWATAEQIGFKAAQCNISDIAAMGGTPQWMFIALAVAQDEDVDWIEGIYRGLNHACQHSKMALVGGDTTRGPTTVISITLLGYVYKDGLCLRSHAKPGDRLMVTGTLGASAAALDLLTKGRQPSSYLLSKHLEPTARMDIAGRIASLANAMIDISDGLGSEIGHICKQSNLGANIFTEDIPLHTDVIQAGEILGIDPLIWALSGGEDYELLFSIPENRLDQLDESGIRCYAVGRMQTSASNPQLIKPDGETTPLVGGYDHFH